MIQESWLDNPSVKKMDKRKVQVLAKLMRETDGKPVTQCIPALMQANNTLRSQGLSFNREETKVIIDIMTKNMTPQEQAQAQRVMAMFGKMKF